MARPGRPRKIPTEVVYPQEPEEDFSDISGNPNAEFMLENQDPSKKYCWVVDNREDRLRVQSQWVGWRPVKYAGDDKNDPESGVYATRPTGAVGIYQEGEEIKARDHVAFECSRERWERNHRRIETDHLRNLRTNKQRGETRTNEYRDLARNLPAGVRAGLVSGAEVPAFQE